MYIYSPVSVFCSRHFSVKQLKFEIYIILCLYSYICHSFLNVSKNKIGEINISDCNFLTSRMISKKCEVWKIYHTEYGPFLATDWLKTKGSGRLMG